MLTGGVQGTSTKSNILRHTSLPLNWEFRVGLLNCFMLYTVNAPSRPKTRIGNKNILPGEKQF